MRRHEHTADRGGVSSSVLTVTPGAADLVIHSEQAPDRLFTARFEDPRPAISVAGGTVRVRYRYSHLRTRGEVALAPTVRWAVEVQGGAHKLDADLTDVPLASFDIEQGANLVTLRVSQPAGWVPVRIGGGASHVMIVRPSTAAARLNVQRGAAQLVFDGQLFGAVGGDVRMESPPAGGVGGYDIHVGAGARHLTVATAERPSG